MMNLIYYSIGSNIEYINLLNLSLISLQRFYKKNFELLFIVDENISDFESNLCSTVIPYTIIKHKGDSINLSSMNKLRLSLYKNSVNFEKIIYCDCDTIWCNDPVHIFDKIYENYISVSNQPPEHELMTHEYFSNNLLSQVEKEEITKYSIRGFNAGVFGLNGKTLDVLDQVLDFAEKNQHNFNECIEQPYFNVFLFRNKRYIVNLNDQVNHLGYYCTECGDNVLIHFSGGPGQYKYKYEKMINFYNNSINE